VKPVGRQIVEEVCRDFHLTQAPAPESTPSRIAPPVVTPDDEEAANAPMFNTVGRPRRFSFF
jgi:hypothetical protein